MRVVIAGSRMGVSIEDVELAVQKAGFPITVVLCGMANGADLCGRFVAKRLGIPVEEYPADWSRHGKAAGFIRNEEMASKAEALIAVWDGQSRGTRHMIDVATNNGLQVYIHKVE